MVDNPANQKSKEYAVQIEEDEKERKTPREGVPAEEVGFSYWEYQRKIRERHDVFE